MAEERTAEELVREAHRRPVGFGIPALTVSKAADENAQQDAALRARGFTPIEIASDRLERSQRRLVEHTSRGVAAGVQRAVEKVDINEMWRGAGTDRLAKSENRWASSERELAAAWETGKRAGQAIGAALKRRSEMAKAAATPPSGAIADARTEHDRLKAAAAAGSEIGAGRVVEASQLVKALASPVPRMPLLPTPGTPARTPSAEEIEAAGREAAAGAPAWLDRLHFGSLVDLVKCAPRISLGSSPPRP